MKRLFVFVLFASALFAQTTGQTCTVKATANRCTLTNNFNTAAVLTVTAATGSPTAVNVTLTGITSRSQATVVYSCSSCTLPLTYSLSGAQSNTYGYYGMAVTYINGWCNIAIEPCVAYCK